MAGFMQEEIDKYANTMSQDRGLGTPTPAAATPSAPTRDWDGNTNSFVNRSLISPELQGIIDKVTNVSSSMSPRQRGNIAGLAGVVGGLQQNRMNEQGKMAQLGVTGANALNVQALQNAGTKTAQTIATQPGMLNAQTLAGKEKRHAAGYGAGATDDELMGWNDRNK